MKCRKILIILMLMATAFFTLHSAFGYSEEHYFVFDEQERENEWTYPVPISVLEDPMDVLRLINRENLLEKDYPDQSIAMYEMIPVTAPVTKSGFTIRGIVNDALVLMLEDAQTEGIKFYVGSAYRNYRSQEVMYYNHVKKTGWDDGIKQPAGASEHQAGLAADVVSWAYRNGFNTSFGETKEGKWLAANCAKYGFIIRYPQDKKEITGVSYEPWHVRYVGIEAATYITASGLTLEEFTEEWKTELKEYNQNK